MARGLDATFGATRAGDVGARGLPEHGEPGVSRVDETERVAEPTASILIKQGPHPRKVGPILLTVGPGLEQQDHLRRPGCRPRWPGPAPGGRWPPQPRRARWQPLERRRYPIAYLLAVVHNAGACLYKLQLV